MTSVDPTGKAFPAMLEGADLLLRAARGEEVERVPVWLHRQAGRYDPNFRAVREKHDFFTICRNPELACEVTLQPIDRFQPGLDASIIFSDILVTLQAMGVEVQMVKGTGPVLPEPIREPADLARTSHGTEIDVHKELGYVFDAITLTRHSLGGRVPLIGFCGAPWTLFSYMTEGRGVKSWNHSRMWLLRWPEESRAVLQTLADISVAYLVGQVRAGAQMLEVFDSWSGDLSPRLFKEFILPGLAHIASRVKQTLRDEGLPVVPMTIFPRGAHFALGWLAETEFDVISLDWGIEADEARRLTKGKVALQGNLDPAVLYCGREVIDREARRVVESFGARGFIFNLGHGMLPDHEPRAVQQLIESVREHSARVAAESAGNASSL